MPALMERQPTLPGLDVEPLKVDTTRARAAIVEGLRVVGCRIQDARRAGDMTPLERLAVDVAAVAAEGIAGDLPGYLRQAHAVEIGRRVLGLLRWTAWLEVPR